MKDGWIGVDFDGTLAHYESWEGADVCEKHFGEVLPITCVKDLGMVELYDDRAVTVQKNTGRPLAPSSRGLLDAELKTDVWARSAWMPDARSITMVLALMLQARGGRFLDFYLAEEGPRLGYVLWVKSDELRAHVVIEVQGALTLEHGVYGSPAAQAGVRLHPAGHRAADPPEDRHGPQGALADRPGAPGRPPLGQPRIADPGPRPGGLDAGTGRGRREGRRWAHRPRRPRRAAPDGDRVVSRAAVNGVTRVALDGIRLRYGAADDPGSAWAHMSATQRQDAIMAACARIVAGQDLDRYEPAVKLITTLEDDLTRNLT